MKRTTVCAFGAAILLTLFSSNANATSMPAIVGNQPAGLSNGDTYRLLFLYNSRVVGTQSLAAFDGLVQARAESRADLLALGATWKTILSTDSVDARDRTDTCPTCTDVPIYLLNNEENSSGLIATGNADFWDGALLREPTVNSSGHGDNDTANQRVWTGTLADGTKSANPMAEGVGTANQSTGLSGRTSAAWVEEGSSRPQGNTWRLYAISDVLTAVPEPASALLLLFGACGMLATRSRRM